MGGMERLIPLALAAALLAAPATAQEEEGNALIEEGVDLLFRGLLEEVAPPLQELAGIGQDILPTFQLLAQEMGPAFAEVIEQVDSIANYEPPAFAPNGDIVLRRRADAPAWTPPLAEADPAPEAEPGDAPEVPSDPPREVPDPGGDGTDDGSIFDLTPPPEAEPLPDLELSPSGELEL